MLDLTKDDADLAGTGSASDQEIQQRTFEAFVSLSDEQGGGLSPITQTVKDALQRVLEASRGIGDDLGRWIERMTPGVVVEESVKPRKGGIPKGSRQTDFIRALPSQERLRELFVYDDATGNLIWRISKGNRVKAGDVAGCVKPDGYRYVGVDGVDYRAHRLVWVWHYGEIPDGLQVDHRNLCKVDNRVENLRLCNQSENRRNAGAQANNTSGLKGVDWYSPRRRWRSRIKHDGNAHFLGYYDCLEEAGAAYATAARALHGEFLHHSLHDAPSLPLTHKVWHYISRIPGVTTAALPGQIQLELES